MRSVKLVIFPTTSLENPWIPVTIDAANSPPGKLGRVRLCFPEGLAVEVRVVDVLVAEVLAARPKLGS